MFRLCTIFFPGPWWIWAVSVIVRSTTYQRLWGVSCSTRRITISWIGALARITLSVIHCLQHATTILRVFSHPQVFQYIISMYIYKEIYTRTYMAIEDTSSNLLMSSRTGTNQAIILKRQRHPRWYIRALSFTFHLYVTLVHKFSYSNFIIFVRSRRWRCSLIQFGLDVMQKIKIL